MHLNDIKKFWNDKITTWEDSRYLRDVNFRSKPLQVRLETCADLLKSSKKLKILEIGCGSGYLLEKLDGHFIRYHGIDISDVAIKNANVKHQFNNIFFDCRSVQQIDFDILDYDVVVSLGLLDWIQDSEIQKMISNSQKDSSIKQIHSFSNKTFLLSKIHRAYAYIKYGYKNNSYLPQYHTHEQAKEMFYSNGLTGKIIKKKTLGIARLIHNL
jgi:2-polyprenyl-3-methyl-5-hydroxy-6-metoxy-1,4-benzoquinol methylase